MAPSPVTTPVVLTDPGYLFWAPLATTEPTSTVVGSVFTDAWAAAWIPLGATEDGSTFHYEIGVEAITVAEFFDPIKYATVSRSGNFAFNLTSYTANNLKRAFNGGTLVTTGTTTTTKTTLEPPDPGTEVRAMLGWESLDNTVRLIARQCLNGGAVESAFKKVPDKAVIPCQFNFEVPAAARPFQFVFAGVARTGT